MKLLFSEAQADYAHYIFPYAVWAFPEPGETPADLFDHGFLPSSRELDRFYLCRQVRVHLPEFRLSSENRRILRKGAGISHRLLPRGQFDYTPQRREFYKNYTDVRFGEGSMSSARLDSLFAARVTSHVLLFLETASDREVGAVVLYLEPPRVAYYYYAFYDLGYLSRNLGMFMMTSAVELLAGAGFEFLYLGSCYSQNALYKTQFSGAQFFNGVRWSTNLDELKFLVSRQDQTCHLLESEEYRRQFCDGDLGSLLNASRIRVAIS